MPELPEVETIARDLRASGFVGLQVQEALVRWPKTIARPSAAEFPRRIHGQILCRIDRYGKYLILQFDKDCLLIHLRMTGRLHGKASAEPLERHEHVVLRFAGGRDLRFRDTRKFGRFYLVRDRQEVLAKLGPDPIRDRLSAQKFSEKIAHKNRCLKPLLLDQTFLAGLGNIYVDEALWESCLHPQTSSRALRPRAVGGLYRAILKVLRRGIRNAGTSIGKASTNFYSLNTRWGRNQERLKVFRRTGEPCPRCQTLIKRIIVGQRSTHLCPHCQKCK